nr:N acetyltransferase ESCO1 [Hymenolepis microstoma]
MAFRFKKRKRISKALTTNQMILDFGQKNFGPTKCKVCSMIYVAGDAEDLKSHQRFHSEFLNQEVKVPRGLKLEIHEDYFNGDQIVEISLIDKPSHQFFSKLSALMNQDLGHDRPSSAAEQDLISLPPYCRIFIYIKGHKKIVTGCCIAEDLTADSVAKRGYQLRRLVGGRKSLLSWHVQNSSDNPISVKSVDTDFKISTRSTSGVISLPLCGVRRLWVSERHRRKGFATSLVDCVIKHLFYLSEKTRLQVAFAEPTAAGAEFAVKYTGHEDFIIY